MDNPDNIVLLKECGQLPRLNQGEIKKYERSITNSGTESLNTSQLTKVQDQMASLVNSIKI